MAQVEKQKLIIREIDPENVEYRIGDQLLLRANHDDDGWNGMGRIEHALTQMAKLTGIEIEYDQSEDSED